MPGLRNLLAELPPPGPDEHIETILQRGDLRIQRIVSHGQASPEGFWYDQPNGEWVLLVSGGARLRFDDGRVLELSPGSFVNIPARQRHRVEWADPDQPTVWLAVHYEGGQSVGAGQNIVP